MDMGFGVLDRTEACRIIMFYELLVDPVDGPHDQSVYHVQVSQTLPVTSNLFKVHCMIWIGLVGVTIMVVVAHMNIDRRMEARNGLVKERLL